VTNVTMFDTSGAIGICVATCGSIFQGTIQQTGLAQCFFDSAVTVNDYVQISSTANGQCHDAGATFPTTGQVLGRTTNSSVGGTTSLLLFSPEIKASTGVAVVATVNLTAQQANIGATTLTSPVANGYYRASCYLVVTQAATTSSTLPFCQITYTDADSNVAETAQIINTSTANTVGAVGGVTSVPQPPFFFAKSGVAIQYSTGGYTSVGATPMQYAIHVRLEGPL